jgi:hypothetical protein
VHRYLADEDVMITVWRGAVTRDEWAALARSHRSDPGWPPARRRLTDVMSADSRALSEADIDYVSSLYRGVDLRDIKLAIVAGSAWKLARYTEQSLDVVGLRTIVFNTVDVACSWLGVDVFAVKRAIAELKATHDVP